MNDIDLENPLHKLIVSKILLDAKYSGDIEDFNILLPAIHNICRTDSGSIFLEFLMPVSIDVEKIIYETGCSLISKSIAENLWNGRYGYYINLSAYIYREYSKSLSCMSQLGYVIRGEACEIDTRGMRFYIYKLIRFDMDPQTNMFMHINNRLRDSISEFNRMHDSVYDSLAYKLRRAAKENMSILRDERNRGWNCDSYLWNPARFTFD